MTAAILLLCLIALCIRHMGAPETLPQYENVL